MGGKDVPTRDAEAFSSFVQGRVLLDLYLQSGDGERLKQACDLFARASKRDANFHIARLYLGVSQTELRDSAAAISNLKELVEKQHYLPEAHLQLAYAYTKRYEGADYVIAEHELQEAKAAAEKATRSDLLDLIEAYRIFLLAVRGGRGQDEPEQRKNYLQEAITGGQKILANLAAVDRSPDEKNAIEFEANNAMGIAFMWRGKQFPARQDPMADWTEAEKHFRRALAVRPKAVRALQNMGTLRMFQGDYLYGLRDEEAAKQLYEEAKGYFVQSLALNPFDQFPHYRMAVLSVKTDQWSDAQKFVDSGRTQKGAVKPAGWDAVQRAITTQDRSQLEKST